MIIQAEVTTPDEYCFPNGSGQDIIGLETTSRNVPRPSIVVMAMPSLPEDVPTSRSSVASTSTDLQSASLHIVSSILCRGAAHGTVSTDSRASPQDCLDIAATQGSSLIPRPRTPVFEVGSDSEFAAALHRGLLRVSSRTTDQSNQVPVSRGRRRMGHRAHAT